MDKDHKISPYHFTPCSLSVVTCNYSRDTIYLLIELKFFDGNKITYQVSKIHDHYKSYHESEGGIILVGPKNEFGQSIPVEVCGMGIIVWS